MHALLDAARRSSSACGASPRCCHSAVEELLRFESPLQLNNRLATASIELAGAIAAGDVHHAGHRRGQPRPGAFAAARPLDIARKPNLHVGFGHGAHACAGMNVARLEARVALAALARRLPRLMLDGTPERDPRVRFRGFRRLPVRW